MIDVKCACGKSWQVATMFAGRQLKCPECGAMVSVPAALAAPDALVPAPPPASTPSPVEQITRERFAVAKSSPRALCRHLPFTTLSGLGLVVAFFCLPWMRTSCMNMIQSEPTGYNLATNTLDSSAQDMLEKSKSLQDSVTKMAEKSLPLSKNPISGVEPPKDPPWGSTTPELWIFPGLGAALVAWGLFRIAVPSYGVTRETVVALIAVMAAGGLLIYERAAWYRKKPLQNMKADFDEAVRKQMETTPMPGSMDVGKMTKDMLDLIHLKNQPGFWLTVVCLAGAALTMLGWLIFKGSGEA